MSELRGLLVDRRAVLEPRPEWGGLSVGILFLLAVGLVLRVGWAAVHPVEPVSDFDGYNYYATTVAEDGAYDTTYQPPGWPVVLGIFYALVGVDPQLGGVLGASLDWVAVAIAALAASRLLPPAFAVGAVGAMCLYPGALAYGPVLATEHLAAPLFTGVVVLMAFTRPSIRTALAAGLLDGALLVVRGEYGVAIALVIAVWLLRGVALRRIPALAAVTVAGALVFVGPWIVRNASRYGEFIPTSTNGGVTFYLGTLAPEYTESAVVERLGVSSDEHPKAHENRFWRLGLENVAEDPLGWIVLDVRKIYHQYGEEELLLYWGEIDAPFPSRVAQIYWLSIVALALVGFGALVAGRRRLPPAWWVIAGAILAVALLQLAFLAHQRDRLPLTYLLIVIAALGAQRLAAAASARRTTVEPGPAPTRVWKALRGERASRLAAVVGEAALVRAQPPAAAPVADQPPHGARGRVHPLPDRR